MVKRGSFIKLIRFWGIIFPIGIGISIVSIDVISSYHYFNSHTAQMRTEYTNHQKQIIKQEVDRVVDLIAYERSQSEILTKEKIKSRGYEAHSIAQNIYQRYNTTKNDAEIQQMIIEALRPIRFEQESGYYFIIRTDGVEILFADKPEMDGLNLLNFQDTQGQYVVKDMIGIVEQSDEGFYEYHWTKPDAQGKDFKKISFVKRFEPYDWLIGAGLYVVDVEDKIKADLLSTISRIRFGKEGYIFINRLNGDNLVSNGKLFSGTKKLWEAFNKNSEKIKNIFDMEHRAALNPDGDYIYYSWEKLTDSNKESPKTSFIYGIPDLQWLVGAGVYLDDVETDIAVMRTEFIDQTKLKMLYSIMVVMGISAIIILFFNWLNRRLKNDFKLFVSFFNRATYSHEKIDRKNIKFVELDQMVENANKMLADRKQADEALRESEEKYRYLIEKLDDIVWTVDLNLDTTYVSPSIEKNLGFTPEERMVQNPVDQLTQSSYKNIAELLIKELNREQEPGVNPDRRVRIEIEYYHKNGSTLWFENIISGLRDKNGILCGFHGVARDISERKAAEKEKIKAQIFAGEQKKLALVGQVAGKMAHDFNNILGIIMGNTELSLMDCTDEETKKTLELIFEQTLRGKNLTRNLVAFAKDQEPKQEFFRINEKIDLVISLLKKDLEGIELIKEDKSRVPELLADPGMIEHALVNLIQNAIHATSIAENPRIIVRTYCSGDNICFEIEDNGCGIPKEHMESIYDPSFTLKGSKDTTGSYESGIKGTGYGMANVKKYIEQHKGNISVESEFNSGTKFTICLPIIKKELTNKEKAEIRKETAHFEKYILLVEDEQAISDVQYRILTQDPCHHKVDTANNGQVAIDLFDRNEYDFISLDYVLPGKINGMDVYDHIRKTNTTIPILFISGNIEFLESIKELKQKDTKVDHLSKPCQNKNYVNSINKLMKKSGRNSNNNHMD